MEIKEFAEIVKDAYFLYSQVEIERKLPHAADGLKQVQRRILYAMYNDLHLGPKSKHIKSARVVGVVIGKYHPHGDKSVYDAMVKMAQPFSLNETLVDGSGNFGSIDGDSAAAMRYTEARLSQYAFDKVLPLTDYSEFIPTYDGEHKEPVFLPSLEPVLLINGAFSFGTGFNVFMPPHDPKSVRKAVKALFNGEEDPLKYLKISFPTDPKGEYTIEEDYIHNSGGRFIYRASIQVDKKAVIITGLPYNTSKPAIITKILNKLGKYLSDADDDSHGDKIKIVLYPNRKMTPARLKEKLYKETPLESRYRVQYMWLHNDMLFVGSAEQMLQHWAENLIKAHKRKREKEALRLLKEQAKASVILKIVKQPKLLEEYVYGKQDNFTEAEWELLGGISMKTLQDAVKNPNTWKERYKNITQRLEELHEITSNQDALIKDLKTEYKI